MTAGSGPASPSRSRLAALLVFAAAMGWLEGVVVVYIRDLIGLARGEGMPEVAEVMRRVHALPWLLPTEQTREAATIAMLAAVAWLAGDRLRSRFGAFLVVFGVWDIVYYAALFALLRWPPGFTTMDVLFFIPPSPLWHQPVWVPLAISAGMIGAGLRLFRPRKAEHG
jgi:hypothetical protein